MKEISTRRLWRDSSAWSVSRDESQPSDEFPSSKFSEARVANKRRNNRLPVYFSGDGVSCFSFTVAVHDDDDGDAQEIHAGQLAIRVKRKRERKSSDRVGSFHPTARKLYEVLSATSSFDFTGRRLLLATRIRFNANSLSGGSLSNRRQFSYGRFNFFYIFSFVSHQVTELSSSVPTKIGKLSCNFISFSLPFSPLFIFSLFTAVDKGE